MLKIGLVQFSAQEGAVEKNCSRIEELIKKYAMDDIDLLCFPELCISGYHYKRVKESCQEKEFFAELAQKYNISIMAGINVIDNEKYYDAVCLWDEAGKLLGEYRKIHLCDNEWDFFTRGEELTVIPFKGWNIGVLICADLRFAEVSTPITNMGADIIIYPSAWIKGWRDLFLLCAKMRATENQVYVIALNRATGDVEYCGSTSAIDPSGNIICSLQSDKEGYIRVDVHKEKIQEARDTLQWQSLKLPHIYKKFEQYRFIVPDCLEGNVN